MTEHRWLKNYPSGIPATVDVNIYSSLTELIESNLKKHTARPAFHNMGTTLSYGEVDRMSRNFAAFLQSALNLGRGDVLALMMPNILQYPIALYGGLRGGITIANVNPLYTPRELRHQLIDSGAKAIVILDNFAHVLAEVIKDTQVKHVIITRIGDMLKFPKSILANAVVKHIKKMVPPYDLSQYKPFLFNEVLKTGNGLSFHKPKIERSDLAFLQYTGGTTGLSKGAMISHGNIVSNIIQALTWIKKLVDEDREGLTIITPLPLYHMFALMANCLVFTILGGLNVLITNPRDISGLVKEMAKWRFAAFSGVNTLFAALLNHPEFKNLDFSYFKLTLGGGMACQKSVADLWLKTTGVPMLEAYGLTEASPGLTINPVDITDFSGYVGLPLPSTIIEIRDEEGRALGENEVGEIYAFGPQIMQGYYNRPEETAQAITPDGWLRTGDMGIMDERGYLKLVDRKKDMIIVSGFNVYPNEIEEIVSSHPGILEAAAIGVPSDKTGEAVKVYAVKKDPKITEDDLIQYCRKHLTAYKVPKIIEFRPDLPKTNVGKILRRELRDTN